MVHKKKIYIYIYIWYTFASDHWGKQNKRFFNRVNLFVSQENETVM